MSAPPTPLTVGDACPLVQVTDFYERKVDTSKLGSHILIFTAGSRDTFGSLIEVIGPLMTNLVGNHPTLKHVLVNIADLREVPESFQGVATTVLEKVDNSNRYTAQKSRGERKETAESFDHQQSYFIPDYSGETLDKLVMGDANSTFRILIAFAGTVRCVLHSDSTDFGPQFTTAITSILEEAPAVVGRELETAAQAVEEVKTDIPARNVTEKTFTVTSEHTYIAWDFHLLNGSEHVEFGVFYTPEGADAKQEPIYPMLKVFAKETQPMRGGWCVAGSPGTYLVRWSNEMSTWSSKQLVYKIFLV